MDELPESENYYVLIRTPGDVLAALAAGGLPDGEPSALWSEAYDAVGPSRDDMWDWLEAKYLAQRAMLQEELRDSFTREAAYTPEALEQRVEDAIREQEEILTKFVREKTGRDDLTVEFDRRPLDA